MAYKVQINAAHPVTDEAVIGHDPEGADMGNPDGAIYGKRIFIYATTLEGRRFVHGVSFENNEDERAARFASRVQAAGAIDLQFWGETYEVYGSAAWSEADNQREEAHQASTFTAGTVRDF